jgi:TolB-like protein
MDMAHRLVRRAALLPLAFVLILFLAVSALAAPQRVVILPFTANAKGDISFLIKGVRDMLTTRLAWQDKVTVIEPDLVAPVMKQIPPPYNDDKARSVGKKLTADVVVFGSITAMGQAVSVDARVVKVNEPKAPPLTAFVQASDLDQVIPRINDFAQRINADIFKRPEAIAAMKKAEERTKEMAELKGEGEAEPSQRKRLNEEDDLPATMSPLNPLFLRSLSGVESDRYWRSPRIDGQIVSLAVADIDLDGKNEILALLEHSIKVYRLSGKHFSLVTELKNGPSGDYMFVDAADIDGDGRPEIFVSNLNNYTIESFVLVWNQGGGFKYVAKDLPYFFRVQPNPEGKGHILLGQKRDIAEPMVGPIYYMKAEGGTYVPTDRTVKKPLKASNLYNLLLADLNGSGRTMTLMIGLSYDLMVFSPSGDLLFQGGEVYNASDKIIRVPAASQLDNPGWDEGWYFLPTRMVLSDLDGDGRAEVILVRNLDRMGGLLGRMRMYYQGTIYSLYWNGMSMMENWRTPRIGGYITDYTIADVGNVGRPALVMSISTTRLKGMSMKDQGHIVAFTLKPSSTKTPAKPKGRGL